MKKIWIVLLGVVLVAALVVPLTAFAANHGEEGVNDTHSMMQEMMDAMHGEGSSERMHETMPGSEGMMAECASMMEKMGGMDGMMEGHGMMQMMGGMGR